MPSNRLIRSTFAQKSHFPVPTALTRSVRYSLCFTGLSALRRETMGSVWLPSPAWYLNNYFLLLCLTHSGKLSYHSCTSQSYSRGSTWWSIWILQWVDHSAGAPIALYFPAPNKSKTHKVVILHVHIWEECFSHNTYIGKCHTSLVRLLAESDWKCQEPIE